MGLSSAIIHHYYYSGGGGTPEPASFISALVSQTLTNVLQLTFDGAVNLSITGWTVSASGGAVTVTSVIADNGTTTPKFSLSRVITPSETITISYSGGDSEATNGVPLNDLTDGAVSNNVHIYLSVDFTGTTLDTSKGTITNPDSANILLSQNDALRFRRVTDTNVSNLNNFYQTVGSFNRGVFSVVLNRLVGFLNSGWRFHYYVDANNRISIVNNAGVITLSVVVGGVVEVSGVSTGVTLVANHRVKITYESNNDIKIWQYTGGAWAQMLSTYSYNIAGNGKARFESTSANTDAAEDIFTYDQLRISDQDYSTQLPEDQFV